MDSGDTRTEKETWTTVGKKPAVKKDKSSNEASGSGIIGATKAAAAKAAAVVTAGPRKPEAIRVREEQLNRLKKKTAPLPEAMSKRSGTDSGDSSDSDERQDSSQREKAVPKKSQTAPVAKSSGKPGASLQAALKKVDYKTLSAEVDKVKAAGQANDAALKLVANHLNEKLKDVPVESSFYAEDGLNWRYPLSAAPKELTKLLDATFCGAPKNLLEGYLEWLITDGCRTYLSKQRPIHGNQLIIQHLLSKNPDLVSDKSLTDRASDLKTFASRKDDSIRDETLAILWAYGQSGIASFSKGFDVWYKLMFPLLNDRRYTGFIVAYLQKLLENHKKPEFGKINRPEVFLNIFDNFFGKNTVHFHKSTKAKISEIYDRLKTLLFKDKLKDNAVSYFAHFLMRLGHTHQPERYHQAASENLVHCLKTDDKCLDVWRGKHESSLRDSQVLLQHVLKSDDDETTGLRRSKKFSDFLDHVADYEPAKGKKDLPEGFAQENDHTVNLAKKLKLRIKKENSKSKFKRFVLFVFFIAAAVTGEIMYNTPKGSYAVQGYNVAKPLAIKYWTVAKPAAIQAWEEYIKPFSLWAAAETVVLVKYSFQATCNLWASVKTNMPQVYAVFLAAQEYLASMSGQFGALCYRGLRKLDLFLVDLPPISQLGEKLVPLFDYARERFSTSLVYVGHLVESYIAANASTPSSGGSSPNTK